MELLLIIVGVAILGFLISMAFNKMGKKSTSPNIHSRPISNISTPSQNPENVIINTLDGGKLIFSEDGVTYVSNNKKIFIKKSEITSFNYEKLSEDVYRVKIASHHEAIDTTVNKNELRKLFMPVGGQNQRLPQVGGPATPGMGGMGGYTPSPSFSWLGPLLGFGAGMLAGSLLDDLFSSSHANPLPQTEHSSSETTSEQASSNEANEDNLDFPENASETANDLDVDAAGFGINEMDSTYDDFSQDLDDSGFDNTDFGDDLSFPDDSDLV